MIIKKTTKRSPKKSSLQDTLSRSLVSSSQQLAKAVESFARKLAKRVNIIVTPFANALLAKSEKIVKDDLLLSVTLLFLPIIYMLAAFSLITNIGLGKWVLPAALLLWAVAVAVMHRDEGWKKLITHLMLFLIAFALIAFLTSHTLDRGHDSRLYHAAAVLGLLEGVNPYLQYEKWVTLTYPAAHWLLSSALIKWTQSFETSFALTVVATFVAFLCSRRFLETLTQLSVARRNFLAFLLAANPIATWCFFDNHVDGMFASTLISVFMLMLCFTSNKIPSRQNKKQKIRTALWIAAMLVLLVNIKFTGPVFIAVLGMTALAYGIRRKTNRKTLLQLATLLCGVVILGVTIFGFFPYATNVAQNKNPFYPAIQFNEKGHRIDTLAQWMEPEFYNKSNYEKWWISLFSKNGKSGWDPAPLPPFSSLSSRSFQYGYSSFFSGALLLCLPLLLFMRHKGAWIVLAGVMGSILSTSASFEFRLTPQNWWLPILVLAFLFERNNKITPLTKTQRKLSGFILACLCAIALLKAVVIQQESLYLKKLVLELEKEGGWYAAGDYSRYYESGLTGIRLPVIKECPEDAQKQKILGLVLCRP